MILWYNKIVSSARLIRGRWSLCGTKKGLIATEIITTACRSLARGETALTTTRKAVVSPEAILAHVALVRTGKVNTARVDAPNRATGEAAAPVLDRGHFFDIGVEMWYDGSS